MTDFAVVAFNMLPITLAAITVAVWSGNFRLGALVGVALGVLFGDTVMTLTYTEWLFASAFSLVGTLKLLDIASDL